LSLLALVLPFALAGSSADRPADGTLALTFRCRYQPFKACPEWQEISIRKELAGKETAIILCDVWDDHWCKPAARRCAVLAKKIDKVLHAARAKGVIVIHAPSECMGFYKDYPQRRRMAELPKAEPPKPRELATPPLPIDDSDGGCDDEAPAKFYKAWSREHPAVSIGDDDFISDNGKEIYRLLKARGIKTVLVAGVHTNMCILNRSFAIKQLTRWGVPCVLLRDLTDAMYNPKKAPFVPHADGTELVIQHIEKHYCPSALSADLLEP
jgi:nicotinamidase-related amidase